jgi:hypothetical protein
MTVSVGKVDVEQSQAPESVRGQRQPHRKRLAFREDSSQQSFSTLHLRPAAAPSAPLFLHALRATQRLLTPLSTTKILHYHLLKPNQLAKTAPRGLLLLLDSFQRAEERCDQDSVAPTPSHQGQPCSFLLTPFAQRLNAYELRLRSRSPLFSSTPRCKRAL